MRKGPRKAILRILLSEFIGSWRFTLVILSAIAFWFAIYTIVKVAPVPEKYDWVKTQF